MSDSNKALDFREFQVRGISLIGKDGTAREIRYLVQELILRQDVLVGYMHGEMMILDATDTHYHLDVTGGEYVWIHLSTPFSTHKIAKAFRVFKVSNRTTTKNDAQQYTIHLVSQEMYLSNLVRIRKAYTGTTIANIAEDIIKNRLDCNRYIIDQTDKSQDIIIPNWRPSEALNWLASRAVDGKDYSYLFYENLDGLQFRSLHKLYKEPVVNDKPYSQEVVSVLKDLESSKYIIDRAVFKRDFDILKLSNNGGIASEFIGVDPVHRTVNITESNLYDVPTQYELSHVPDVKLPNGNKLYDNYESNRLTFIQTPDNQAEIWHKRVISMAALYHGQIEVTVPGNMDILAGSMVDMDFRVIKSMPEDSDNNIVMTGAYFVSSVAHVFHMESNTFDTVFSMYRDSLPAYNSVPDMDIMSKVKTLEEASYEV